MSNQETYRKLCQEHPDIPLFMQAWWLDASDMPWDVILYTNKGKIAGFYVYSYVQKWGHTLITQPTLTQYSGPFLFLPNDLPLAQRYSLENKAYNYFIAQLEAKKYHFIEQNWHHSQTNHQPFYWQGFKQSTRYTYVLDNTDTEAVWQGLSSDKKKKYLRSEQSDLRLSLSLSHVDFYHLYKQCLSHKGQHIYYPFKTFEKLYLAAKDHQCGQILAIYDKQNQLHAALWIVWDNNAAYNMIIPIVEAHKSSGASTRLIFEAMRLLQGKTKQFDFEGSMIQGVALHNQSFGAQQIPFHHLQKSHSKLLSLWRMFKQ